MTERLAALSAQDRAAILDFWVRAWAPVFPAIDFEARRAWLSGHLDALLAGGAVLLVRRHEGTPVAFATAHPVMGELDQLAVDPTHAAHGHGAALLEAAKAVAPGGLTLRVNTGNGRALRLYERAGFVAVARDTSPRSGLPVTVMRWPGLSQAGLSQAALSQAGVMRYREDAPVSRFEEPITVLSLTTAQSILTAALDHAGSAGMKPLCIVVLDARGATKASASQDGTSLKRHEIAHGKAFGALSLGMGSRSIGKRAVDQAYFVAAVSHVVGGQLVPVAGGVLVRDASGALLGAVGASGDTSDNDEAAVMAGIKAAGLTGDPGQD